MSEEIMRSAGYTAGKVGVATVYSREQWAPHWNAPKASVPGHMRGIARGLEGTNFAAGMVYIPVGQMTPDHYYTGEHLIFQLSGSTRFVINEEEIIIRPHDLIFIPANVTYRYGSVGLEASTFVNILGRVDEWPATSHYPDVSKEKLA